MKNPPRFKIFDQPQQILMLSAKKITQNFFRKRILIFNAALLHLKFYYIYHELLNLSGLLGLTLGGGFQTADWTSGGPRLESCILIGQ